jgi:hypothetical protein
VPSQCSHPFRGSSFDCGAAHTADARWSLGPQLFWDIRNIDGGFPTRASNECDLCSIRGPGREAHFPELLTWKQWPRIRSV